MYKIAISGKANSGKNTFAKLLHKEIQKHHTGIFCEYIAFADPIKKIIRTMFPNIPEKFLTGSSEYRSQFVPGAFKNGKPVSVRELLVDIGNSGRFLNKDIWIDPFNIALSKAKFKNNLIIVTDVRLINEFIHLKKFNFFQIRLIRNSNIKIDSPTEVEQDYIIDNEFNYVVSNNSSIEELKLEAAKIVSLL